MDSLPHDEEAERSILGAAMLNDEGVLLVQQIPATDYYFPKHALIAQAMHALIERGQPLDVVLLIDELKRTDRLNTVGGMQYVGELSDYAGTLAFARDRARLVQELAQRRRIVQTLQRLVAEGISGSKTTKTFCDSVLRDVMEQTHTRETSEPERLGDVLAREWKELESGSKQKQGWRTGLRELDEVLLPIEPKQLVYIAARPSAGKTSFVMHLVSRIAREGGNCLFFSLETTKEKLARRALSQASGVGASLLSTGHLDLDDWESLSAAARDLHGLPIWIDDGYDLTGPRLRAKCRRMTAQHGPLGVVVIDYVQLLESSTRGESREREISEISRGLKRLAKEFQCPILALSQLNRDPEKREGKAPSVADLRGSGQLEQDADVILLMQRSTDNPNETIINVGKQKDGPTGEVRVRFDGATMRFGDL